MCTCMCVQGSERESISVTSITSRDDLYPICPPSVPSPRPQAMEHGYAVEILEPDTPWRFKTAELARYNTFTHRTHTSIVQALSSIIPSLQVDAEILK